MHRLPEVSHPIFSVETKYRRQLPRLLRLGLVQAAVIQQQLADAKAALAPVVTIIERAVQVVREAAEFNRRSQTAKIPLLTVTGDIAAIRKLGEIRVELPDEWRSLPPGAVRLRMVRVVPGLATGHAGGLAEGRRGGLDRRRLCGSGGVR